MSALFLILDEGTKQNDDVISEGSVAELGEQDGGDDDDDNDDGNSEEFNDNSEEDAVSCDDNNDGESDVDNSDDERPSKKKRKLRDAREGKTIFIRNLPFDATEEEILEMFEDFGGIAYCKIVVDSATEHSRGSAFVKFQEKQSADECLKKYGDENDGSEGKNVKSCLISVYIFLQKFYPRSCVVISTVLCNANDKSWEK